MYPAAVAGFSHHGHTLRQQIIGQSEICLANVLNQVAGLPERGLGNGLPL